MKTQDPLKHIYDNVNLILIIHFITIGRGFPNLRESPKSHFYTRIGAIIMSTNTSFGGHIVLCMTLNCIRQSYICSHHYVDHKGAV